MDVKSEAITAGDSRASAQLTLDWIVALEIEDWLELPRIDTPHNHGTGSTLATSATSAVVWRFSASDTLVLAEMATAHMLRRNFPARQGVEPVSLDAGFGHEQERCPASRTSWISSFLMGALSIEDMPGRLAEAGTLGHGARGDPSA